MDKEEALPSVQAVRVRVYRTMDPARKLRAVFEMFELALQLARTGTRMRHPGWTDEQVEAEARRLVTGTTLYRGADDVEEIA
jgi:hypothetical protein